MGEKRKEGLLSRAADMFDLPAEALAGDSRLTITGNKRLVIENHKGLMEYGENQIEINCGKIILKVKGENLEIRAMNSQELLLTGLFLGIEFV